MSDLIRRVAFIGKGAEILASALQLTDAPLEEADVAVFIVSASDGIVRADSDRWATARELYIPSIVVITELDPKIELDFEDMAAIAGRILDPVSTPFLVLHDESSAPVALIDLATLTIRDYSTGALITRPADPEHVELVKEFAEERAEQLEEAGETGFENGLLYPALPWVPANRMGEIEIKSYLELVEIVPSAS